MGFRRMLQWMVLALIPLYLVTGCGDLEPEMQDTRTVILNMDFHGKSSSRSSSSVSASELSQYNTHLWILKIVVGSVFQHSPNYIVTPALFCRCFHIILVVHSERLHFHRQGHVFLRDTFSTKRLQALESYQNALRS